MFCQLTKKPIKQDIHLPVWPGDVGKLLPPSVHNNGHVEPEHERHWYKVGIAVAVSNNLFKHAETQDKTITYGINYE